MSPQAEAFHRESWWGWAQWWSESFPIVKAWNLYSSNWLRQDSRVLPKYSPAPCHPPVFRHKLSPVLFWYRNMWGCCSRDRLSSPRRAAKNFCFHEHTSMTAPASGGAGEACLQPVEKGMSFHTWDNSLLPSPLYKHTLYISHLTSAASCSPSLLSTKSSKRLSNTFFSLKNKYIRTFLYNNNNVIHHKQTWLIYFITSSFNVYTAWKQVKRKMFL